MEAPIKVAVISEGYGRHMAFVTTDFSSLCDDYNRNQAIVDALEAAGVIEVVDVFEQRRMKRDAQGKAELAKLASEEPTPIPVMTSAELNTEDQF